ncbi:MAG TPA: P-loop NTPase fold protein, partial [Burkholderiaceae bacterium]|nr:P-loop NTPase fold protein [Burkholderiaceae bacterium]
MKYRLPELDVPDDNPFQHDALDRKPVVEFLSGLIRRLSGPFVLALDSPWGTGKTTLIRMLQADLKRQDFQCLYFNAWKVDYVTDPLVALVGALDDLHLDDDDAE